MKTIAFIFLFFSISTTLFAGIKKVDINCSEPDAQIFQDGKLVGVGTASILVKAYSESSVIAKKEGFFDCVHVFYNDREHPKTPSFFQMTMTKDDAFESSTSTDIANNDIDIKSDKKEDKVWKLISEVITSNFDILEVTDKSSGYIRTAWVVQSFKKNTIRTRVILKSASSDNASNFKIKIISEYAEAPNVSAKDDEKFKPWSRILKKYSNLIPEIQSRVH